SGVSLRWRCDLQPKDETRPRSFRRQPPPGALGRSRRDLAAPAPTPPVSLHKLDRGEEGAPFVAVWHRVILGEMPTKHRCLLLDLGIRILAAEARTRDCQRRVR